MIVSDLAGKMIQLASGIVTEIVEVKPGEVICIDVTGNWKGQQRTISMRRVLEWIEDGTIS